MSMRRMELRDMFVYRSHEESYGRGARRLDCRSNTVLHDGDVVTRSDGFGTTATRTPVSRTMSITFWISRSTLVLNHSLSGNSTTRPWAPRLAKSQRFYYKFIFFGDFPL